MKGEVQKKEEDKGKDEGEGEYEEKVDCIAASEKNSG